MFFIVFGILEAGTHNALFVVCVVVGVLLLLAFYLNIRARERREGGSASGRVASWPPGSTETSIDRLRADGDQRSRAAAGDRRPGPAYGAGRRLSSGRSASAGERLAAQTMMAELNAIQK
jgi:hypothetical protein